MEGQREGEKHQRVVASHILLLLTWLTTQGCALTGNQTCDHLVRRLALNTLNHTSQGDSEPFKWTRDCQVTFDTLKEKLVLASTLGLPNLQKPFKLYVHEGQGIRVEGWGENEDNCN